MNNIQPSLRLNLGIVHLNITPKLRSQLQLCGKRVIARTVLMKKHQLNFFIEKGIFKVG